MKLFGKKEKKMKPKELKKPERNPFRLWRILFFSFLGIVAISIAFHIYLFLQINQEEFFNVEIEETTAPPEIHQDQLDAILERFDMQLQQFQDIQQSPPSVSDPAS